MRKKINGEPADQQSEAYHDGWHHGFTGRPYEIDRNDRDWEDYSFGYDAGDRARRLALKYLARA